MELISNLKKAGLNFIEDEVEDENMLPQIFSGQTWCITGSFEKFKPRTLAEGEIQKRGGRTTSTVTGKTTHLLAGESAGSKLLKAQNIGTTIISENDFMELLKII